MKTLFARLVLLLNGAALALAGLALVDFLLHPLAPDHIFQSALYRGVAILALTPLTLLVGFLVLRRVPGNLVGPLLILWSGSVTFSSVRPDIHPVLFALFSFLDFFGWVALFTMLLQFPDGRIYPPGAAPWIYRLLGVVVFIISLVFISTATFQTTPQVVNPFYLPALENVAEPIAQWAVLFFAPIIAMALISPALRYRRGSLRERQQIKWLALFGGLSALYTLLGLIIIPLLTGGEVMNPGNDLFAVIFYLTVGLFPPTAIGVAVLRHRLWDIDILIRRTLVYGSLTAALALVYFGLVTLLQASLSAISNQQSEITNVLSTLAIAALFTPLRRGIQNAIDRRFYRQKYNAERVLANLSAALRDEVELDHLKNSILRVVDETVQPAHASLWLREADLHPGKRSAEG